MQIKNYTYIKNKSKIKVGGRILKIGVINNIPNLRLVLKTVFNEVVVDDVLQVPYTVFHPRVFINQSPEYPQLDYHIAEYLYLEVQGGQEDEKIEHIIIYHE